MPDQSKAATEHAITQDLSALPAAQTQELTATAADPDFPVVLRGYDRDVVDAYVQRTNSLIAELQATQTPDGAVRRALERVGEEVAGILRRAHETAEEITSQSRREADDRLQAAILESHEITAKAKAQLRDLDADTDRIWAERHRILDDARALADEMLSLADNAAERFPASEEADVERDATLDMAARDRETASAQEQGEEPGDELVTERKEPRAEPEAEPLEQDGEEPLEQRGAEPLERDGEEPLERDGEEPLERDGEEPLEQRGAEPLDDLDDGEPRVRVLRGPLGGAGRRPPASRG